MGDTFTQLFGRTLEMEEQADGSWAWLGRFATVKVVVVDTVTGRRYDAEYKPGKWDQSSVRARRRTGGTE